MRCGTVLALGLAATNCAGALQSPFRSNNVSHLHQEESWDLSARPHNDSTSHLIFDTVGSLLQHWPNTRYRNGHNIIPATVSPGTILYHGRTDSHFPTGPEWTATDPEHAYLFCRRKCWQLTLVVTRPLKLIYFDGSAAAKMTGGPLDSQDYLIWGKSGHIFDELGRLNALCAWGKEFGLDGFVRMEMDFEIMFCDFTAGLEVVSFLNLVKDVDDPPRRPRDPNITEGTLVDSNTAPPGRRVTDPSGFESVHSGTFHDRFPGDTRIQLDLSALVSFYDPALAPSLIEKRRGLERWDHRLEGIHNDDLEAVRKRLSDVLTLRQGRSQGSGIDWQSLVRVIIKRYEKRLELLQYILQSDSTTLANEKDRMIKAHVQLNIMLVPYILTSAVAPNSTDGAKPVNSSWASPIFRHCATAHTAYIASLESSLTRSELLLLSSVQETTREICRALVTMWSDGVLAGVNHDNWNPVPDTINGITEKWRSDVNALMGWLDWSTWVRCKPACGFEELCYLPTWPFFHRGDEKDWARPQPSCVRRIEPYSLHLSF